MSEQSIMKPRKVEAKLEEDAQEKETIEETNEIRNELGTNSTPQNPPPIDKATKLDKNPKKSL